MDTQNPILASSMGWGSVLWLPYLQPIEAERVVYTVHQYAPHRYTHQKPYSGYSYLGIFDLDWDGWPDCFDRSWLMNYLAPIQPFQVQYRVPMAVNEFGVVRWAPNAADFMRDQITFFEQHGMNHALWVWEPTCKLSANRGLVTHFVLHSLCRDML